MRNSNDGAFSSALWCSGKASWNIWVRILFGLRIFIIIASKLNLYIVIDVVGRNSWNIPLRVCKATVLQDVDG